MFKSHDVVNHGIGEYTIEGYFSILKRGIVGVYRHVGGEHLKRYLAEFDSAITTARPLASATASAW